MFITIEEAIKLIESGKVLHIAGDEFLLEQLPKGNWIGGTTPYFITEDGGVTSKHKLFVDEISDAIEYKINVYNKENILNISKDSYENGISFLIMPFASEVAVFYSKEAPNSEDILMTPIIGWISGFDLSTNLKAKTYNGFTGEEYEDKAVVLHIGLPENKIASMGIVNIFNTENSDKIEFLNDTLLIDRCLINGEEVSFIEYIEKNNIDIQLPLVADYNGVLINVSIKEIIKEKNKVALYAPVFKNTEYRFAIPVENYEDKFKESLRELNDLKPLFSCNCILNYLHGKLEGKKTTPFAGPVTFGEVAYHLLNQTLVYVNIIEN